MEELTLQRIADEVGISAGYLSTLFPKYLGCGYIDYLNQIRIRRACGYLKQNYLKTYQIAHAVGYQDEKYFSRVFAVVYTPTRPNTIFHSCWAGFPLKYTH